MEVPGPIESSALLPVGPPHLPLWTRDRRMATTREEVGKRGGGEVIDNTKTRGSGYGWVAGLCVSGLLVTDGVWLLVLDAPAHPVLVRPFWGEPVLTAGLAGVGG